MHLYPVIGDRPLDSIQREDVQAPVNRMSVALAPATTTVANSYVSTILKTAAASRRIPASPCVDIHVPEVHKSKIKPLSTEQVLAIRDEAPSGTGRCFCLRPGPG